MQEYQPFWRCQMNRSRHLIVWTLALSICFAFRALGEEGVQDVDAAWVKAIKANSLDGLVACYASDAVAWFPNAPEAKGEKEIRAGYENILRSYTFKDAAMSDTHYQTTGDTAVGWGKFTLTLVEDATGKT